MTLITEDIIKNENYKRMIGNNLTTNYADYQRLQPLKLFWVDLQNGERCLYNYNNERNSSTFKIDLGINAGLRPLLIINTDVGEKN